MYFQPVNGPLDTVARDEAGFEKNGPSVFMTTYSRFGANPVETFANRAGPGLISGVVGCIHDELGCHVAGGECLSIKAGAYPVL